MSEDKLGIGMESQCEFSLNTYLMSGVTPHINKIVAMECSELEGRTVYYFLDALVLREQLNTVNNFFNQALGILKGEVKAERFINLNFGIRTPEGDFKKVLFQFKRALPFAEFKAAARICDITHFLPNGAPEMFVIDAQGEVAFQQTGSVDGFKDAGLQLTKKEIDILLRKGKGMRAKEIASELGISHMTVYSIIRDVKSKSGMELVPLIMHLRKLQSGKE